MKTTKEMAEIMLAYDRGEHIEKSRYLIPRIWFECKPEWDWHHFDYRIKLKTKYVPFETADEFLEAQKEHGIEVKDTLTNTARNVFINFKGEILMRNKYSFSFIDNVCEMFGHFTFLDGTPCGKEVKV